MHKNRISRFYVEIFLAQYRKFLRGTLRCFKVFRETKNFMHRRGRFIKILISFSVETLMSHSTQEFVAEQFCLSKKFSYAKISRIRGGYNNSPSETFCLTVPKSLCFRKSLLSRSIMVLWIRGGRDGVSRFYVKSSFSHCTEKFRKSTLLCFIKSPGIENLYALEGGIKIFRRKFFVSQ